MRRTRLCGSRCDHRPERASAGAGLKEAADITGIVLTKLDGTAKGGVIISIQEELGVPVRYIGVGEDVEDLQPFDAAEFVRALFAADYASLDLNTPAH